MSALQPVAPVSPIAKYVGGKRNLARRLTRLIDNIACEIYAEPFVGMGGIFLRRSTRPRSEVINDISGDVVTLFRILQEHYPYFIDMLRWRITSRSEFDRLTGQDPDRLTDLQRAARFLYLQRLRFGGNVRGKHFGVDARSPGRFDITKLEPMLAEVHERLAGVTIERLPYADFIRRYDYPRTLFYLDPPYWGCEETYGPGTFSREDFSALAAQLGQIKGGFILSINDTPGAREVFSAFRMTAIPTTWTFAAKFSDEVKKVDELIITNLPEELVPLAANDP